jgi:DNA-binding Lrp family transcriptional regulator
MFQFFLVANALSKKELVIKSSETIIFTETERNILNELQKHMGFKVSQFEEIAKKIEIGEEVLLDHILDLQKRGVITRIGPFFNLDRSSGYVSLVAMTVPDVDYAFVTELVNAYEEVAHNYRRDNKFNMWFVLAANSEIEAMRVLGEIEMKSGYKVFNLPKLKEYSLDLFLEV